MRFNRLLLASGIGLLTVFLAIGFMPQINFSEGVIGGQVIKNAYASENGHGASKEMLEKGRKIFAKLCATCHGPKGDGKGPIAVALNPKPADFTDSEWKHGGSDEEVLNTITKGVPGTAMTPFGGQLKEEDREAVAAYIKSLSKK